MGHFIIIQTMGGVTCYPFHNILYESFVIGIIRKLTPILQKFINTYRAGLRYIRTLISA